MDISFNISNFFNAMSAFANPDQKFDTGWEITNRNADGTITGRDKKTGKKHTTRRIDWSKIN